MASEPVVLCPATAARCQCVKPFGHVDDGDDLHVCTDDCGGSWRGEHDTPDFEVVTYPGGASSPGAALAALLGIEDDW